MNNEFGLKELYDVSLKLTYSIEVSGRIFETGETIAVFDKIQMANFSENKKFVSANGGYDNRAWVWWEDTKDIAFSLTQGVFSKTQMALMTNARLTKKEQGSSLLIGCREELETNEKGIAVTKHLISEPIFVYDKTSGEKVSDVTFSGNQIITPSAYWDIIVDYQYDYNNGYDNLSFSNTLTNGFLSLEGKTRVKDDITGQVKTGIIKIPKLKLLSNLSMRLGNDAIPQVGRLDAVAIPEGPRGSKRVMELYILNDDIDSDM